MQQRLAVARHAGSPSPDPAARRPSSGSRSAPARIAGKILSSSAKLVSTMIFASGVVARGCAGSPRCRPAAASRGPSAPRPACRLARLRDGLLAVRGLARRPRCRPAARGTSRVPGARPRGRRRSARGSCQPSGTSTRTRRAAARRRLDRQPRRRAPPPARASTSARAASTAMSGARRIEAAAVVAHGQRARPPRRGRA